MILVKIHSQLLSLPVLLWFVFLKILFRNFRDCFVVQLSKFVTARLKQLVYSIKPEEVCQQLFSFISKFLSDLMESVLFRVVLADSLIMIPLLF